MDKTQIQPLNKVSDVPPQRILSGYHGFDRLMGDEEEKGIVKGSALILAGIPGAGKSTLLVQLAFNWATLQNLRVLYIAGEENNEQIKIRTQRLGINSSKILLYEDTEVEDIIKAQQEVQADILIIDSLQMLHSKTIKTHSGSPTQIRNGLLTLTKMAKETKTTIIFVGHSTKGGYIAGSQTYQHMVDTVLYFDIDEIDHSRILQAKKNRFGSIDFQWVLQMTKLGLVDPEQPIVFTQPEAKEETTTSTSDKRDVSLTEDQVEKLIADHPVWGIMVRASMNFLRKEIQKTL